MGYFPPSSAIILVCVLPSIRDFDIARMLGWYRIPLKKAPKIIDVDYLAFYQPGTFGEDHRWQVEFFAELRGHELTTRAELLRDEPDHPRANEEYYRLQIGELQPLPEPIPAGNWKRFTFLYSTGRHLRAAQNLKDLVVKDDERELLWKSLRERAVKRNRYRAEEIPETPLDPELLALLGFLPDLKLD